jgi:hypothetical protein
MADTFLHGIEVIDIDDGIRPIQTARSSVIGLVGTAPAADATLFPLNTPVMIITPRTAAGLGTTGTLPAAVHLIHAQGIAPVIVVIRVPDVPDDPDTTNVNERLAAVIGGTNTTTGERTGIAALLSARGTVGVTPRILLAPGFSQNKTVADALIGVAQQVRGVAVIDGPNSTSAAAITYRRQFGSDRAYIIDPAVVIDGQTLPASPAVAGLMARIDNERGFWWSPSNNPILGVTRAARAVDFELGNTNSEANLLNEEGVATLVNEQGLRLWGNRSASSDPKWVFLSVRRTADMIHQALLQAHLWAVDRAIGRAYVRDVQEGVNAYLRHLKSLGAILGGRCWLDEELNSPANIAAGKVYFDFDFTPPYPAERVTFRSHLVPNYATTLFDN